MAIKRFFFFAIHSGSESDMCSKGRSLAPNPLDPETNPSAGNPFDALGMEVAPVAG